MIGAGHAGVEFVAALRQKGCQGRVDLLSDEAPLPYQRPPLSKDYIKRPGNPLGLGHPGMTEVVRGDPPSGKFSVFLFSGERLQAVESVNAPSDHVLARKLLSQGTAITPDQISEENLDIKTLIS